MLKNDNGSVQITSDKDIQVLKEEIERIKIGRLGNDIYGIRISNADGVAVMETDDLGELWLKNRLRVGTNNTSTVEIGYLDAVRTETSIHEVIHAGDDKQKFIVYEDGKMLAQGAEFHGEIYATGGQIGNMEIQDIEDRGYELIITSNIGNSMKEGTAVILTATLYKGSTPIDINELTYQWYNQSGDISGANQNTLQIDSVNFNNGFTQYGCKVELKEETNG